MSSNVKEFSGKDIASAIKEACDTLGVAQELLDIEVVETGSRGIFGLISKKARIKVSVQTGRQGDGTQQVRQAKKPRARKPKGTQAGSPKAPPPREPAPGKSERSVVAQKAPVTTPERSDEDEGDQTGNRQPAELQPETLGEIRDELARILELMGCPSTVTVNDSAGVAECRIDAAAEHQQILTGNDGRILDSLQYLLRKIVSKKLPGRVQLTLDVGNYREHRSQQLLERALECAEQVKENGKTQVIPSLNPSERRIIHVALQEDPEIRSRSVGEGLFKKVLIYKPGKGHKGLPRKRSRGKYRKKTNSEPKHD